MHFCLKAQLLLYIVKIFSKPGPGRQSKSQERTNLLPTLLTRINQKLSKSSWSPFVFRSQLHDLKTKQTLAGHQKLAWLLSQWLFGLKKNSIHYWHAPRGPRGVKKSYFIFYKWNCFPFALRLPQKDINFKNHQNWRKNVKKTLFS